MKSPSIYAKVTKTAAKTLLFAALAIFALVATTASARPHYIQDVQYVQGGAQLVITPPQLVIQAPLQPVYTQPVYTQPVYAQPVYVQPAYPRHHHARTVIVQPQPVYTTTFIPGRIYYINGRAYLNGHPYRGHGKKRHHAHHDEGRHLGHR